MGLSRSGTLYLIGLLVLIAVSLHPVAGVEAVVERLFAPSRILGELALPFRLLGGSVSAAEAVTPATLDAERARSRAVLHASQAAALPTDPSLLLDRALVSAHVIGRLDRMRDRMRLRFPVDAGVAPGMPVVYGDVFVGRVTALDPKQPGECIADLVTARNFRVGAAVVRADVALADHAAVALDGAAAFAAGAPVSPDREPARFVVGGILSGARDKRTGLLLAAQYPSDRDVTGGDLLVREDASTDEARLADGYRLGRVERFHLHDTDLFGVHPLVDYDTGIDAVAIVCPPQMATAGPVLALDPFDPAAWIDARVLLAGDASPLRSTRKLAVARSSGVRAGAAVAIGARFVGRIEQVGAWSTDARLVTDAGMSFQALARTSDDAAPVVLGALVSRGSDGAGGVWLEWAAPIPLSIGGGAGSDRGDADGDRGGAGADRGGADADHAPISAEIWTAAGEPDVPPGLFVGTTELLRGTGPFRLRVRLAQDPSDALHVRVWRGREAHRSAP